MNGRRHGKREDARVNTRSSPSVENDRADAGRNGRTSLSRDQFFERKRGQGNNIFSLFS